MRGAQPGSEASHIILPPRQSEGSLLAKLSWASAGPGRGTGPQNHTSRTKLCPLPGPACQDRSMESLWYSLALVQLSSPFLYYSVAPRTLQENPKVDSKPLPSSRDSTGAAPGYGGWKPGTIASGVDETHCCGKGPPCLPVLFSSSVDDWREM